MRTVPAGPAATEAAAIEELPVSVQEALGALVGAAKEGLLALSVGVGLRGMKMLVEGSVWVRP
jgi:hypothetical protein